MTALARTTDPPTSHAAAAGVSGMQRLMSRTAVFEVLRGRACADHEIVTILAGERWTEQRIRTARKELVRAGLVRVAEGVYATTAHGRRARVWEVVPS